MSVIIPPTLYPLPYPENKPQEYGTYLVVRADGKTHKETWNNTGWAYNNKAIKWFYLPKIEMN